jgi:purine nucleosidase
VIAYVLWPELFSGRDCYVAIDTSDGPQRGRSTVDWNGRLKKLTNAFVVDTVDAPALFDRMITLLSRLP